ncbi:MAG: HAD family hydrolase [Clostridia bacterium]|nr:HAD family hydrolase [Clostridia bacterium]
MNAYDSIIWDFNGTILDDVGISVRCANTLLSAHGMKALDSVEQYRSLFGFPIIDYYRRMGFDFDRLPYDKLAPEWMGYYLEYSKDAKLYGDIPSVLESIKEKGIPQWILSASEKNMLEKQLRTFGIEAYFDGVLGLDNIHAHSKQEIGLAWREVHPKARVLMIGDTSHDAQVANVMGADCILLTCGHQNRATLESCRCLFVADCATEILSVL